jgi:hypothetical protein
MRGLGPPRSGLSAEAAERDAGDVRAAQAGQPGRERDLPDLRSAPGVCRPKGRLGCGIHSVIKEDLLSKPVVVVAPTSTIDPTNDRLQLREFLCSSGPASARPSAHISLTAQRTSKSPPDSKANKWAWRGDISLSLKALPSSFLERDPACRSMPRAKPRSSDRAHLVARMSSRPADSFAYRVQLDPAQKNISRIHRHTSQPPIQRQVLRLTGLLIAIRGWMRNWIHERFTAPTSALAHSKTN